MARLEMESKECLRCQRDLPLSHFKGWRAPDDKFPQSCVSCRLPGRARDSVNRRKTSTTTKDQAREAFLMGVEEWLHDRVKESSMDEGEMTILMHDAHIAAAATETARDSGKSQEVARQQTSKKQQLTVEGSHTAHDMVAESHGIEGNNEDEIMDDIRQATADDEADDDADKGDNDFVPLGHAAPSVKENSTETPGLSRTPPYQIQQGIESYKYSLLGQYFSEVGQKAHQGMVPSTIPICYRDLVNKMFEITDITTLMSHKKGILKDGETNTDAEEDSEREESIVDSPDQEEAEDEANDSQEKERSIQDNDEGDDSDSLDVSRERAAIDWALDGRVEE